VILNEEADRTSSLSPLGSYTSCDIVKNIYLIMFNRNYTILIGREY